MDQYKYDAVSLGLQMPPVGIPPGIPNLTVSNRIRTNVQPPPLALPGADLPRAVNYYADYGGCGFWRMIWPEITLNGYQRAIINGLTTMVLDPRFYQGIKAVRLQRQATPVQLEFVKFLKHFAAQHSYKVIYEVDDIIFKDDIPDFNRCKVAFENETILKSAIEMIKLSDEMSVTCQYMKDYYMDKTGNKNITVIPNYAPRQWADRFYDPKKIMENYTKNKKRPRVGYCGSGTHIDVTNKTNQHDDFKHVVDFIIKTRKEFQWVMMGCFPLPLKPFIDSGDIEFANWAPLPDYPRAMNNLNLNATFAPLVDCHFNRAKSEIKFLEAAYQGIPGVYQDIITYKNAPLRFTTGSELIDQLRHLLKDSQTYSKYSVKARKYSETMFIEDHLDEYYELYFTSPDDKNRKALKALNP
jgi:hypothetical protein